MEQLLILSSTLLWVVVLFNLLLTFALVRRANTGTSTGLRVGQQAPDFTAQTLGGETMNLASYAGREVAFIFISPHCKPCREGIPVYESFRPQAQQAGVELVLVSTGEIAETRTFVDELKIQMFVLVAPLGSNSFIKDYKASGTPSYCLINSKGKVESTGYPSQAAWNMLTELWEKNMPRQAIAVSNAGSM
jgi:peroxiredoxin